jgi:hypothetical protein
MAKAKKKAAKKNSMPKKSMGKGQGESRNEWNAAQFAQQARKSK